MLIIETYLDFIEGKGIGVFSKGFIPKGTKYWIRNEVFDKIIPKDEFATLDKLASDHIKQYGALETSGNWYLCSDNSKFTNHSNFPNTQNHFDSVGIVIFSTTLKDIKVGEEILCDYTKTCLTCSNGVNFKVIE